MELGTLARIVVPVVSVASVSYLGTFFWTLALDTVENASAAPGSYVSGGDVRAGWRYEIRHKEWVDVFTVQLASQLPQGGASLCAVEVRGYPMPVGAAAGDGAKLRVFFEEPLVVGEQRGSAVEVDMTEATRTTCAALIVNGQVVPRGEPDRDQPFVEPPIAQLSIRGSS
jgi:hypothetical protein